jgi:hypothetical protein
MIKVMNNFIQVICKICKSVIISEYLYNPRADNSVIILPPCEKCLSKYTENDYKIHGLERIEE